ncbi:hypothetical protein FKM82_013986 [Ascaphus truei]
MDSSLHKHYHDDEFDPRLYIETYFNSENNDTFDEVVEYPIKQLFKTFSSGRVRGETLLDVSAGPLAFHLLTACDYFKEINVIEFTDANIREFEMWRNKEPGAADWSHAAKFICELEGKSEEWEGKEDKARRAVKRVVKCDLTKDNPLEPVVLPQVDCLLSMYVLLVVSKDHQAYRSNLKKLASMLKTGGYMLLVGSYNTSYYMIGAVHTCEAGRGGSECSAVLWGDIRTDNQGGSSRCTAPPASEDPEMTSMVHADTS